MLELNDYQNELASKIKLLKEASGSHSPSINTIREKFTDLEIKVDACFLSNPYATELFINHFNKFILKGNNLRELLEFYPSQNEIIAQNISKAIVVNEQSVFVGNGAIEIIQACMHNFSGEKTIINIPTFSSYYEFVLPKTEVLFYKLKKEDNYELDPEVYLKFIKENNPTSIVIINPNNPNGSYLPFEDLRKIVSELRELEMILIDESFIHFAYEDGEKSQISTSELALEFKNVIVVKSMSKDFGIAGVRAGYGIMNKHRVSQLLKNGYLWNSSGLAEYFFRLYKDEVFLKDYELIRVKYINDAIKFFNELKTINNIKVYPTKANFALVELLDGTSSADFVINMLLKYGIYMRSCADKIGLQGEFVRVACRTIEENASIINAFREYYGTKTNIL